MRMYSRRLAMIFPLPIQQAMSYWHSHKQFLWASFEPWIRRLRTHILVAYGEYQTCGSERIVFLAAAEDGQKKKDVHSDVLGICLLRLDPDRIPSRPIGIQHIFVIRTKYKRIRRGESEVLVS
jgi:hypothetical protein